jgi:DNA-binding NtrC family response regulator
LEALADYASLLADEALLRGSSAGRDPSPQPLKVSATDADVIAGLREATRSFQRALVLRALEVAKGNKQEASRMLKLTGRTLYNKMHELGVMSYSPHRPKKPEALP